MAILFAAVPAGQNFERDALSDLSDGVYDAVMLLRGVTKQPYALMAHISEQQIDFAREASSGRRAHFFMETRGGGMETLQSDGFATPRLLVCYPKIGGAFALASLDCGAFVNVHYPTSQIWTPEADHVFKFNLKSGFKLAANRDTLSEDQSKIRARILDQSICLKNLPEHAF